MVGSMSAARSSSLSWLCAAALLLAPGVATGGDVARPSQWAEPIAGRPGLSNLHRVTPRLYRGAQPLDEGFAELKAMGVDTVVNLRSLHSDRDHTQALGLGYVHIRENAWHLEDEDVIAFLRAVTNPKNGTIFVHCQHGADRTGTMIAAYRIVVQGWRKRAAIREMTEGGYGFHAIWKNLVTYVRQLDVPKIKRALQSGHD
jgi:protein tyrosine/serine phosphatase